jgi:hypothetical protein
MKMAFLGFNFAGSQWPKNTTCMSVAPKQRNWRRMISSISDGSTGDRANFMVMLESYLVGLTVESGRFVALTLVALLSNVLSVKQ